MAFFAWLGKTDKEDYEAFHIKCGEDVTFSNGKRTAYVRYYAKGAVYSAKPIPTGAKFQVKIVESRSYNISIGFTRLDPENIDPVPKYFSECRESKDYWMFCGPTAYHDGTRQNLRFSTYKLVKGDSVGVRVSENGDVHYYVNGQNKGRVFQHLPQHQDLWGVVFLLCDAKIQSEFHFDQTKAHVSLLQEKVSRLEVAVQENKGVATTQPGGVSQGDSEEIHSLRQQLATQGQQLATQRKQLNTQLAAQESLLVTQIWENRELKFRVESLSREQASLQRQNQQLTTQQEEITTQLHLQQEELTTQLHQQQEELTTQLETKHEELTAHFQQQLTDQHAEQRKVIQEMQQQYQALLQQVQSLQPSWSIAQHHLQITTQVLGRGAWGEVRVGIYQGTRVAVKKMHEVIISNHNRKLFEREMVVASRVRHPHLVLFIGAVTTGNLTIVNELMETSLRKLLEEEKLKASNLRPISKDVACALAYLHSLPDPIVHRDVSSVNVLVYAKQDGWCAKLSDFGSSNFLAKLGTEAPGAIIYSAPEALDPQQQGPKMDVYSFGVLLFEMCVGELIDQHTLQTTKAAVANWSNREMKFLGEFALRCTETNPDKRPNMADFVKRI